MMTILRSLAAALISLGAADNRVIAVTVSFRFRNSGNASEKTMTLFSSMHYIHSTQIILIMRLILYSSPPFTIC